MVTNQSAVNSRHYKLFMLSAIEAKTLNNYNLCY